MSSRNTEVSVQSVGVQSMGSRIDFVRPNVTVRLTGLNGEPVKADVADCTFVGELRDRVAEANLVCYEDVMVLHPEGESRVSNTIDHWTRIDEFAEFAGAPVEGQDGAVEIVFQVTINHQNETELEKDKAKRASLNSCQDKSQQESLDLSYHDPQEAKSDDEKPTLGEQLDRCPAEICEYVFLKELVMTGHNMTHLPSHLGHFRRLKILKVGENLLERLPDSLCTITTLEQLDARQNKLRRLPEKFGDLVNLAILSLQGNMLEVLPTSFTSLVKVWTIDLDANRLTLLPEDFVKLKKLTRVHIRGNPMERLPLRFWDLRLDYFGYDLSSVAPENREAFVACMPEKFHHLDRRCSEYLLESQGICPCRRRSRDSQIEDCRRTSMLSMSHQATTQSQMDHFAALLQDPNRDLAEEWARNHS